MKAVEELRRLKRKNRDLQMLQDTFIGAIDEEMNQRLKTNPKHRELNLTKLAEVLERFELIYHPKTSQLKNIRQSGGKYSSSLREIVRLELAAALQHKRVTTKETMLDFLETNRENQDTHKKGAIPEIKNVSIASQQSTLGKTALFEIFANVVGKQDILHPYVMHHILLHHRL